MNEKLITEKVLGIVREASPDTPSDPNLLLIDSGYVDSFGAFMILTGLEVEFDIEISEEDMKYDNFRTLNCLVELVKKYLK